MTAQSREAARSGTLRLAGRLFEVNRPDQGIWHLSHWLRGRDGLILAADQEEPLLVLRLGDFLRRCRFRDPVEKEGPKTCQEVSAAHLSADGSERPGIRSGQDRRRSKRA